MVEIPYLGRKGTLSISTREFPSSFSRTDDGITWSYSHHGGLPVREHHGAHLERPSWLELRLHIHEQRDVRRAVRCFA